MGKINSGISWVLRIGVFGTFLGHGLFAISSHPPWIPYLMTIGFSSEMAVKVMPAIGTIDIIIACITLIRPVKYLVLYAIGWAFLTALIRPISGESILSFVERASNWAVPLVLYLYAFTNKKEEH